LRREVLERRREKYGILTTKPTKNPTSKISPGLARRPCPERPTLTYAAQLKRLNKNRKSSLGKTSQKLWKLSIISDIWINLSMKIPM
jgi:hypothetical protein